MKTKPLFLKMTLFACAMLFFMPLHAYDTDKKTPLPTPKLETKEEYKAAYEALLKRKDALIEAKKNAKTTAERKKIKEDIQGIKKEAKALREQALSGGIYIGAGALLIILLLILLL